MISKEDFIRAYKHGTREFFEGRRQLISAFSWGHSPLGFEDGSLLYRRSADNGEDVRQEVADIFLEHGYDELVPDEFKRHLSISEDLLWE